MNIIFLPALLPFYENRKRFKFAYGGRGSGKSYNTALSLLLLGKKRKIRILCAREVQKSIKESVHELLDELINKYDFTDYKVQATEIINLKTSTQFVFIGLKEHTVESLKSYENVDICWVEEAHTVSQKSIKILIPTIRKKGSEIWFTYNRKLETDPVHRLFNRELNDNHRCSVVIDNKEYYWFKSESQDAVGIYINYFGNPYFTEENRKEMEKDKADDYDLYLHIWEGYPEQQGAYALIKRKHIMQAVNRQVDTWDYISIGVDPARYGDDESAICYREGFKIMPINTFKGINTMELSGRVINICKEKYLQGYKEYINIKIDTTGIGSGVTDRLQELDDNERIKPEDKKEFKINVIEILFNHKPCNAKYKDYGTEMWGNIKDALETISLPDDEELISQLSSRKYKIESDGRIKLESKDEVKKRGERSPDRGDALALCLDKGHDFNFSEDETLLSE